MALTSAGASQEALVALSPNSIHSFTRTSQLFFEAHDSMSLGVVLCLMDSVWSLVPYALHGDTCLRWATSMIGREAMRLMAGF